MSVPDPDSRAAQSGRQRFATTHWSIVLAAGRRASPETREALATLCQVYWYPLYAYVRRQGNQPHDAHDLTQEFFARLLEKNYLRAADRTKGKFRSFLLASLRHFLANEWDRAQARKRGGSRRVFSLDLQGAEARYAIEPFQELTAEKVFERRWALTLLETTLARLRDEFKTAGKTKLFDRLKQFLSGQTGGTRYAQIAAELDISEAAVKVAVYRLRRRYRELLRDEIAQTVDDPAEIDQEIHELFAALRA